MRQVPSLPLHGSGSVLAPLHVQRDVLGDLARLLRVLQHCPDELGACVIRLADNGLPVCDLSTYRPPSHVEYCSYLIS